MENILNILRNELINPIDENIANVLGPGINDGDDIEEELDEYILGLLEVGEENGLEIHPRRAAPARIQNYFEETIPQYNDHQFYSHFRMRREVFMGSNEQENRNTSERFSIMELENVIRPHVPNGGIALQKKLLLTIWLLATPESFRSVADRFNLGKTAAHFAFMEIIEALVLVLPQYIMWPNPEDCVIIETAFRSRQERFSGIVGAIDGCHIEMKQPPGNANDYYNRKGTHSIILQGTCDHTGKFIDVLIGRPGRAHDASVFRSSPIFRSLHNADDPLLPPEKHILADSAYPLSLNVLTPFRDNGHLTEQQIVYNVKHASLRSIIERAFGLLKSKFRRLFYLDVKSVRMANNIVAASCTLHNFILMHGDAHIWDNVNLQNNEVHHDGHDDILDEDVDDIEDMVAHEKRIQIMNALFR